MFDVSYRRNLLHTWLLIIINLILWIGLSNNSAIAQESNTTTDSVFITEFITESIAEPTNDIRAAITTRDISWQYNEDQPARPGLPAELPVLHSDGNDILELCTGMITDSEAVIYDFAPDDGRIYLNHPHIWEEIVVEPCHGDGTAEVYLLDPDGQRWNPEILTVEERYQYLFDLPHNSLPGTYWLIIDGDDGYYTKAFWAEFSATEPMINILDSESNERSSSYKEGYTLDARGRTLYTQYFGFPANTTLEVGLYQEYDGNRLIQLDTWFVETNEFGVYSEDVPIDIDAPAGSYYLVACEVENCAAPLNHLAMLYDSVRAPKRAWDWFSLSVQELPVRQAPDQRSEPSLVAPRLPAQAPTEKPTNTPTSRPTNTPVPTNTPIPTRTPTPVPTNTPAPTNTPVPTNTPTSVPTNTPIPTRTPTPVPTNTSVPTNTPTSVPTNTPIPTRTPTPVPTDTPVPTRTPTPVPTDTSTATRTPVPTQTPTPVPTRTPTPVPTNTPIPTDTSTATRTPAPTRTPTPLPTNTSAPTDTLTATKTPVPTDTPMPTETPLPTDTPAPTDMPTPLPSPTVVVTATSVPTVVAPTRAANRPLGGLALPAPVAVTMAFYNAIDIGTKSGDFTEAYAYLSKRRQNRQSYAEFVSGFATTTAVVIESLEQLESDSNLASVNAVIVATDVMQNGIQKASYDIVYQVIKEDGIWKMDEAKISRLNLEVVPATPAPDVTAAREVAESTEASTVTSTITPTITPMATLVVTILPTASPTATPQPTATEVIAEPTAVPTVTSTIAPTPMPTVRSANASDGFPIGSLARLDPVAASDGLNIRSAPGIENAIEGGVPANGLVTILSEPIDVDGTAWQMIEFVSSSGWISTENLIPFADRAAEYINLHWVPDCEPERPEVELLQLGQINCSDTADSLDMAELDTALRSVGLLQEGETIQPRTLGERVNIGIVIGSESTTREGWIRIGGGRPGGIWRTGYSGDILQVGSRCWLRADRIWRCE